MLLYYRPQNISSSACVRREAELGPARAPAPAVTASPPGRGRATGTNRLVQYWTSNQNQVYYIQEVINVCETIISFSSLILTSYISYYLPHITPLSLSSPLFFPRHHYPVTLSLYHPYCLLTFIILSPRLILFRPTHSHFPVTPKHFLTLFLSFFSSPSKIIKYKLTS